LLRPDEVRRVEVEALVDTGATTLLLPAVTGLYIEVLGRDMTGDALLVPVAPRRCSGKCSSKCSIWSSLAGGPTKPRSPDAPMYDMLSVAELKRGETRSRRG
jgi:hypothetical protein